MAYLLENGGSAYSHIQASQQAHGLADSESADLAAPTEQRFESTELALATSTDGAYEPPWIQIRYDEYLAQQALRELFENGELDCLGG